MVQYCFLLHKGLTLKEHVNHCEKYSCIILLRTLYLYKQNRTFYEIHKWLHNKLFRFPQYLFWSFPEIMQHNLNLSHHKLINLFEKKFFSHFQDYQIVIFGFPVWLLSIHSWRSMWVGLICRAMCREPYWSTNTDLVLLVTAEIWSILAFG